MTRPRRLYLGALVSNGLVSLEAGMISFMRRENFKESEVFKEAD